jgi:hypothetical protein
VTSRRAVLAAPVLALGAACGGGGSASDGPPARTAADDAARDRALAAEQTLIAQYDAALRDPSVAADAALTARLTAIRAEHAAHLAAVGQGYTPTAATLPLASDASSAPPRHPSPSPSVLTPKQASSPAAAGPTTMASSPPTPPPTTDGSAAPAGSGLVGALVKAEQAASSRLTADIMDRDGATALLFASIAASEAGHAALLLGGAA